MAKKSPAVEQAPASPRRFLGQAALAFVLLLAVVIYAARVLALLGGLSLDLTGAEARSLSDEDKAFFRSLREPLQFTYFSSERRRMPSDLKRVEPAVRSLLNRIRALNPERIDVQLVDPDLDPEHGPPFAAMKKVSPISVRKVRQDEASEVKIWSSLIIGYGDHPEALIQGITDAHLAGLRSLIVENIRAMAEPPKPVFAVAAPDSYREFRTRLGEYGKVVDVSLDGRALPDADVLFWLDPDAAGDAQAAAVRGFLDAGKSVVLAGSSYDVAYEAAGSTVAYRVTPRPPVMDTLLKPYGLSLSPDILMDRDKEREPLPVVMKGGDKRPVDALFHLRLNPQNYDLRRFFLVHIGAVPMPAASPIQFSPPQAAEAGFRVEVTATSGLDSLVMPVPEPARALRSADLNAAFGVSKQPVFVQLMPEDPWRGRLVVMSSARPFDDALLSEKEPDRLLIRILARSLASPQQLVLARVKRPQPPKVPPLSGGARIAWRLFAVFLVPLVLVAWAVARFWEEWRWSLGPAFDPALLSQVAGALVVVSLAARLWSASGGWRWDFTSEHLNSPAPAAERLLAQRPADLSVVYAVTERGRMPAEEKNVEAAVRDRLKALGLSAKLVRPENESAEGLKPLVDGGLRPFEVRTVVEDREVSQKVWSGLLMSSGGRAEAVPRLEAKNVDHLEFLLAAALKRLATGKAPRLAIASDIPRLSPAEAFMDYQQKGFTAPTGSDVYSHAKTLLSDYGYALSAVDPHAPQIPGDTALLIWFQPHFDQLPGLRALAAHLAQGGKAVVPAQWYNIQQRQYRGAGFKTVYWPQPQYQDLERYVPALGISEVKEVLMDRTYAPLALETQVNRAARREYERQQVAQPFLIRTVAAGMAPDSVITARLGDQLFIWGNRWKIEASTLAALGLSAKSLITTSDRAWAFDWKGGWVPDEALEPHDLLGRQPLVVDVTGTFPPVQFTAPEPGRQEVASVSGKPSGKPGELLLIGSSEMFKNEHLEEPGFFHEQFLLNAVALMAQGPEMAELQARERAPRGFPYQSAASKLFWRLFVLAAVPGLLIAFGLRLAVERPRGVTVA